MKIRFSNLGTIRETEIDLRPLTVIIGPNNSSKTYLAYSIYGLWRELQALKLDALEPLRSVRVNHTDRSVEWSIKRLEAALHAHVKSSTRRFETQLGDFFQDTSNRLFRKTKFDIEEKPSAEILLPAFQGYSDFQMFAAREGGHIRLMLDQNFRILFAASAGGAKTSARKIPFEYTGLLPGQGMRNVIELAFGAPFILPAERNALIITYKILSNRRFKLLRDAARVRKVGRRAADDLHELLREQGEIRYPLPVEDFLDFLADVELPATRGTAAPDSGFAKLAALVESSIQSGNRLELTSTALGGRELRVGIGDDLSIDLYNASSSIKQLSALILYLRYKAAPNQLLIIDEPEMNLHPASQVRLLEVLAILVNLGVRVLVTTHSPYFMAHLANLVQKAEDPKIQKKQAAQLYLKDPRALLALDHVSAYEMRDNRLVSLKDPEFGLRWDTLSDVFSDLQQRYFALDGLAHGKRGK
ncbi:MAG: AAA family ATPase [Nannocystis sp.]|nr:AAA family ATPase [Nannocystis sp.]MBA3545984.1 AAA family ATPase [Nannocystis sp.]